MGVVEDLDPVARCLQELGVEVDAKSLAKVSTLHRAVVLGTLTKFGDYREFVNDTDAYGLTPLHYATLLGNVEAVRDLVELGADPNVRDNTKNGFSSLHVAAKRGNIEITTAFLRIPTIKLDLKASKNGTALHLCTRQGHVSVAKLLIDAGSDVNAVDSKGRCPHHLIGESLCFEECESFVNILCDEKNVNLPDASGRTPVQYACMFGNRPLVDILLKKGADVNAVDKRGLNVIHYAIMGLTVGVDSGVGSCLASILSKDPKLDVDKRSRAPTPFQALETLLSSRQWRKGEDTALRVGYGQLKKHAEKFHADAIAAELLSEEQQKRKSRGK
uniref:Uncharacterized protein n=1 Tax=Mucochytrium quahogii TaxID=96639 RepID=A0A7S2RSK9_9STRA|mmetsp:Transcript_11738/g.19135  ORF Transcript_11738/g.19135 Transcript_11738/m.19135 type:complete len:331 (-) Transcript_11738:141-1133(-)